MKTCNRTSDASSRLLGIEYRQVIRERLLFVSVCLLLFFGITQSANAQYVTLLSTYDFSSSTFPPSGWSGGSGWYWSSAGDGGTNGSAVQNNWGGSGTLTTPAINASAYAYASDSVLVDFDFIWEYNYYATVYGDDGFKVLANNDALTSPTWTESANATYNNSSSTDYGYTPSTTASNWKHFHMLVPVADRTSGMTISFAGIINWGDSNPAIDNVKITAFFKAPTELSLTPKQINFGGVIAGVPVTRTITAYSVGSNNLHISGYGISGAPDYTMTVAPKSGDSIVAGNSKTYTVQFNPLTAGNRNATFTLFTDGADSGTQSVQLSGIGLAPAVAYGTTNLFHRVFRRLGDTSAVQYIPIQSTGTGALAINSVYFVGLNPDNYSIAYLPASPMAPGKQDSIGIRFTPKLEGRPDASVVISTNAFNNPLDSVSLFAVGTLAHLVITVPPPGAGTSMNFDSVALGDSVCQSLSLTNTGSDTLRIIKQVVTSSDYDFSFYPLVGADTMLVPGQSKPINVCFKPIKAGTRLASFRILTNIPRTYETVRRDTSQFTVAVSGVGAAYGRLVIKGQFTDSTLVGQTSTPCIMDTVVNTGQTTLTVSSATITGQYASEYALTWVNTPPSFTLAPGASNVVKICFTPMDRGSRPATLNLIGSTGDQVIVDSFQIAGFGLHECATPTPNPVYDTVLVGLQDTKMVGVQNCGDVATTYTAALASGSDPSLTINAPLTSAMVTAGGSTNFGVKFVPTTLGLVSGTMNLTGAGVPAGTSVVVNGFGTGVKPVGSSTALSVVVSDCANDTITFTNNGNVNWTPGNLTIGGADASLFTIVSNMTPSVVPPGGTGTVVLKFCPTSTGSKTATIDFPLSSPTANAVSGSTVPYPINATGASSASVSETYTQAGFTLGQSYPNPTTSSADVLVTLPNDAAVQLLLVDATGNTVRTAFTGHLTSGQHTLTIDAKGLPSGVYYYLLTSGDVRLSRQMMLVK